MAYIAMAHIAMAYIAMAYIVVAYIVMAYMMPDRPSCWACLPNAGLYLCLYRCAYTRPPHITIGMSTHKLYTCLRTGLLGCVYTCA